MRHLVEIVQHDLWDFAAFQLNDCAHAGLIRFIAQIRDAFKFFVADQLTNLDEQVCLVHLIRQLIDDDGLTTALFQVFKVGACAHDAATTTGAIAFTHAVEAVDNASSREIGRLYDRNQLFNIYRRVI